MHMSKQTVICMRLSPLAEIGAAFRIALRALPAIAGASCLMLWAGTSQAAVNFVQAAGSTNDSAGSSISQAFGSPNAGGNLIVVAASWGDNPASSISASDTWGNTYFLATSDFDSNNRQGLAVFYAPNIHSGANTVTVRFGQADAYRRIIVSEYSGVATAAPLDATAKHQAAGTKTANGVTSSPATTTANGDLIFGAVMDDSGNFGSITAGTGFTRRAVLNNMDTATEDRVQTTAGSLAATFTFSRADYYLAQMVAFRAASSGTGGSPSLSSLACTPTTLSSGAASACTVTLTQAAPAGGTAVSLSSSNTAALTVPAAATVLAGSSSATFSAVAGSVSTNQTATITATAGTSKSVAITVTAPPAPQPALAITSSSLPGGELQVPYSATLVATGGSAPYSWTVLSGQLPDGLSLTSSTGGILGTPTVANFFSVVIQVSDQAGATVSADFSINIGTNIGTVVPTLVQHVSGASTQSNGVTSYTLRLPNGTQNGNCIIAAFQYGDFGSPTASVVDDQGNTYALGKSNDDGNQIAEIWYALNVAPGTRAITISFSGTSPTHVTGMASEFYNVATSSAVDGTPSSNSGSSTSITAGSITTTVDRDLIYQYAIQDTTSSPINSWTQGSSPWALLSADIYDSSVAQYQVQAAHGSINPALTTSPSNSWNSIAIALKSASAGNAPPAGIHIVHVEHQAIPEGFGPTPLTMQFPSTGNLLVSVWLGISTYDISSIGDTQSNTYNSSGPILNQGASGDAQIFYAGNATPGTTLTQTYIMTGSSSSGGSVMILYDIAGAAASPYDTRGASVGKLSSSGSVTSVSVTPSTANGLVIAMITVESHTITGVAPGLFDVVESNPILTISPLDQNGGLAHNYNTDTSPETYVWTTTGGELSNWASIAAAFH